MLIMVVLLYFNVRAGFQPLEELYYKTWLHSGQRVIIQEIIEKQNEFIENVLTIQGLSPTGYLFATSPQLMMVKHGNFIQMETA
ncbi:unnamed protein product [Cuscuta campestris]|uniref:Uncharacterized protein n=1 Tax=Cuscuta campestris TaxID=132261 RepID=A0A484KCA0_9ASTE|nr:unnamed protein product [Cuscuta campestris]